MRELILVYHLLSFKYSDYLPKISGRISLISIRNALCFQADPSAIDPRGRSPLHLAVALGHLESTRVLLRNEANANEENSKYWSGNPSNMYNMICG